jgi:hypothetical protein
LVGQRDVYSVSHTQFSVLICRDIAFILPIFISPASKDVFYWQDPSTRLGGGGTVGSHKEEHLAKNGMIYSTDF